MDMPGEQRIAIVPTGAAFGADVIGGDLSRPFAAAAFDAIESAWHRYLVLRSRAQRLDDPALLAFARRFGELDAAGRTEARRRRPALQA